MFYAVYPLRLYGQKLHPDDVRARRVMGELQYYARRWNPEPRGRIMCARLLANDGETYVLPLVDRAWIEIQAAGILIQGTELIPVDKSASIKNIQCHEYRQSWVCKPAHLDRPERVEPSPAASRAAGRRREEIEQHNLARKIGQTMTDPHVRR